MRQGMFVLRLTAHGSRVSSPDSRVPSPGSRFSAGLPQELVELLIAPRPPVALQIDPTPGEDHAFAFEELALPRVRLAADGEGDAAARIDDALPRHARARGAQHRADEPRTPRQ